MYGLPADIDLTSFTGVRLQQVCIGANEAILNFENSISLNMSSDFRLESAEYDALYRDHVKGSCALAALVDGVVTGVSYTSGGTLTIRFDADRVLEVYDSSHEYESYQLHLGTTTYVV
jgi:hypothetical protein